jgi:hypothetical protein
MLDSAGGSPLDEALSARSIGVVCFGAGIVAFWALRGRGQLFGALVPLFRVGIAGLLLGYSTGFDRGVESVREAPSGGDDEED